MNIHHEPSIKLRSCVVARSDATRPINTKKGLRVWTDAEEAVRANACHDVFATKDDLADGSDLSVTVSRRTRGGCLVFGCAPRGRSEPRPTRSTR